MFRANHCTPVVCVECVCDVSYTYTHAHPPYRHITHPTHTHYTSTHSLYRHTHLHTPTNTHPPTHTHLHTPSSSYITRLSFLQQTHFSHAVASIAATTAVVCSVVCCEVLCEVQCYHYYSCFNRQQWQWWQYLSAFQDIVAVVVVVLRFHYQRQ